MRSYLVCVLVILISSVLTTSVHANDFGGDKKKRVYNGEFKNGKYHGEGTMKFQDGSVYTGSWENGAQQGWGHFMWADGDEYEGNFKRGKLEGEGTYYWADGSDYHGGFKKGLMHGSGKLTMSNGNVFEGIMAYGYRNGPGKVTMANGIILEATYQNGIIQGGFSLNFTDHSKIEGKILNGELDNCTFYYTNDKGVKSILGLKDNQPEAVSTDFADHYGWLFITLSVEAINHNQIEMAKSLLATIETIDVKDEFLISLVQQQNKILCETCGL